MCSSTRLEAAITPGSLEERKHQLVQLQCHAEISEPGAQNQGDCQYFQQYLRVFSIISLCEQALRGMRAMERKTTKQWGLESSICLLSRTVCNRKHVNLKVRWYNTPKFLQFLYGKSLLEAIFKQESKWSCYLKQQGSRRTSCNLLQIKIDLPFLKRSLDARTTLNKLSGSLKQNQETKLKIWQAITIIALHYLERILKELNTCKCNWEFLILMGI